MNSTEVIAAIRKHNLLGRSGSAFPTADKWELVKKAAGGKRFVVCNGSEGAPGVLKDGYILDNYPEIVVEGIDIALDTVSGSEAFMYLRADYFDKHEEKLKKIIGAKPITLFKERGGYLSGEETTLFNVMEGERAEPRLKPPYPTDFGLRGRPTLINNVETLYTVARIVRGEYKNTRFYSLVGDIEKKGVFELPVEKPMSEILKETGNWPDEKFFVQVGDSVQGEIMLPDDLDAAATGSGSLTVYLQNKTNLFELMKKWTDFLLISNCDKCVPCREGVFQLAEMVKHKEVNPQVLADLFYVMKETSFCPLGKGVPPAFISLLKKTSNIDINDG